MTGSRAGANPYIGPRPFETGERLFGRDRELTELLYLLSAERIVLLHSPSGAGKSSLIQAGLIPVLRERFDVWRPTRVGHPMPEDVPVDANRHGLSTMLGFEQGIPEHLRRSGAELAGLRLAAYVASRPRRPSAPENILLVFDQFEEILTADPLAVDAKRLFFDQLGELLQDPLIWALFSLREDYLAPIDPYAQQVPTHLRNRYRIDLLGIDAAREAIVRPAPAGGRRWADPAVDKLVRDLATVKQQQADGRFLEQTGLHVEPMQLQVVCRGLWDRMPADDLSVDPEDVETFGNVTHALGGYYAAEVQRIAGGDEKTERVLRAWVGDKLITADGIRIPVLRAATSSEGLANALIERLVDVHLVRTDHRGGALWYELAHDRLVRPVREDNEHWAQANLQPVQVQAALWARQGRPMALLLSEEALTEAERWVAGQPGPPGEPDGSFLEASRVVRAQERVVREAQASALRAAQELAETQTRAATRQRLFTRVVGAIGILALFVAVLAFSQYIQVRAERARAEQAAARSRDHHIMSQALLLPARDAALTPYLLREVNVPDPNIFRSLLASDGPRITHIFYPPETSEKLAFHRIATTPRRDQMAVAYTNFVRIWSTRSNEQPIDLGHQVAPSQILHLTEDGRYLIAGAMDGRVLRYPLDQIDIPETVRVPDGTPGQSASTSRNGELLLLNFRTFAEVWRRGEPGPYRTLQRPRETIAEGLLSPSGAEAVLRLHDGSVWVWHLSDESEPRQLDEQSNTTAAMLFPDQGDLLITVSPDKPVRILDLANRGAPRLLRGESKGVSGACVSPSGSHLLTMANDTTPHLWQTNGSVGSKPLVGHTDEVTSCSFSPNGSAVITASLDRTARVWNVADGSVIAVLGSHEGPVSFGSFWADANHAVTIANFTVRFWSLSHPGDSLRLSKDLSPPRLATASRDRSHVFTVGKDGTAYSWLSNKVAPPKMLQGPDDLVSAAAWTPDELWLGIALMDGSLRLLRPEGETEPIVLGRCPETIDTFALAPGADRAVVACDDRSVQIWDRNRINDPIIYRGHLGRVTDVAISSDGQQVTSMGMDATVRLWSPEWPRDDWSGTGHPRHMGRTSQLSTNGRLLVNMDGRHVRIQMVGEAPGARDYFNDVGDGLDFQIKFSKDERKVFTSSFPSNTIRMHDLWSGTSAQVECPDVVRSFAVSSDEQLVAAVGDVSLSVASIDGKAGPRILGPSGAGLSTGSTIEFSPDSSRLLVADDAGSLTIWQVDGSDDPVTIAGRGRALETASFSPDGEYILTVADGVARLWRAEDGLEVEVLPRPKSGKIASVATDPQSARVALVTADGRALLSGLGGTDESIKIVPGRRIAKFAFSPIGTATAAVLDDGTIALWRDNSNAAPRLLQGPSRLASFSPDGRHLLTASADGTVRMLEVGKDAPPLALDGHQNYVNTAEFSPDGTSALTASDDHTAKIWSLDGGLGASVIIPHESSVSLARFAPDGRSLVTIDDDDVVRIWGSSRGELLRTLSGVATTVAWSESSRFLACSASNTVEIWDLNSDAAPLRVTSDDGVVASMEFMRNDEFLLTRTDNGTVWVQRWDYGALVRRFNEDLAGCLAPPERRAYLLEEDDESVNRWRLCEHMYGRGLRGIPPGRDRTMDLSVLFNDD